MSIDFKRMQLVKQLVLEVRLVGELGSIGVSLRQGLLQNLVEFSDSNLEVFHWDALLPTEIPIHRLTEN